MESVTPALLPLLGLPLFVAVYLAPTIVAAKRGHHHAAPIFVLNLLLGWTFLGWVASLVWAVMPVRPKA